MLSTLSYTKKGDENMDPFTFGIVATGTFGSALVGLAMLGKSFSINDDLVRIVMEVIKHGAILYLLKVLYMAFFL
jgi:hypothetical protein